MDQHMKKCTFLSIFGTLGAFNNHTVPIFSPNYLFHISSQLSCPCQITMQYNKNFLV